MISIFVSFSFRFLLVFLVIIHVLLSVADDRDVPSNLRQAPDEHTLHLLNRRSAAFAPRLARGSHPRGRAVNLDRLAHADRKSSSAASKPERSSDVIALGSTGGLGEPVTASSCFVSSLSSSSSSISGVCDDWSDIALSRFLLWEKRAANRGTPPLTPAARLPGANVAARRGIQPRPPRKPHRRPPRRSRSRRRPRRRRHCSWRRFSARPAAAAAAMARDCARSISAADDAGTSPSWTRPSRADARTARGTYHPRAPWCGNAT